MEPTQTSDPDRVGAEADELSALRASIERVNARNRELQAALREAEAELARQHEEHHDELTKLRAESRRKSANLGRLRYALARERQLNMWLRESLPYRIYRRLRGSGPGRP